jgi:hypothetical protein
VKLLNKTKLVTSCMERALLEKLILTRPVTKLFDLYGTRNFITVFTKALTGPYSKLVESNSHARIIFL